MEVAQADSALAGATKILRTYGFDAVAEMAEQKAAATDQARTVVVVGEVKRGKSSLVNALIGVRGAAPVSVDSATSATLSFVEASPAHPAGEAGLVFPGLVRRVPAAELAEWTTSGGRHVRDPDIAALPTRAVVGVASARLRDLTVIDTPGSGGLDAVHAQLSLQSARQASVLVVVCDASAQLSAPEMEFIRSATATVESVIVAVTKTDKNLRRWKPILAENQRLLQQHLHRSIPVLPVSSVRALTAAELPPGERRDQVEIACGITGLRSLIEERLSLGEHRNTVDGLRTALEGLRKVHAKIAADIAITKAGDSALPELTAQRDRLAELKEQSGQWEQYLGRDLAMARQRALTDLDGRLDAVKVKWTTRIKSSGLTVLRKNPQVFTAEIEADLLAAMAGAVQGFLGELRAVVVPLFDSEVVWEQIEADVTLAMASGPSDTLATGEVGSKRQGLLDPSVLTMGMIGTSMLGALIGVGAIAGVVWVGVNLGYKAMRAGTNNLLAWLRETLSTAKSATARMLEAALVLARPEIVLRYREHIRLSTETVQKQMADAKEAARLDAAARDATLKRLMNNQRVVTAKSSEIENTISRLTAPAERASGS